MLTPRARHNSLCQFDACNVRTIAILRTYLIPTDPRDTVIQTQQPYSPTWDDGE